MKILVQIALASSVAFSPALLAQKAERVYRWVDENGDVHYSESLPPDFRDKRHDVLDNQGITRQTDQSLVPEPPKPKASESEKGELPRDASGMKRPEPMYSPAELRSRQYDLLLRRYDSEQEILDAIQVEINQLDYDRILLGTSRSSLEAAYRGNIREAADRQRAGLAVEDDKAKELRDLRRKLDSNRASLAALEKREASIRAMFESELDRYRRLSAQAEAADGEQG